MLFIKPLIKFGPQSKIIGVKEFCHSYTLIDIWNAPINEEESYNIENIAQSRYTYLLEIEQIHYFSEEAKSSTNYFLYSSGTTGVVLKPGT
ncbi:hypothetical protein F8M41_017698 [Gigaspora margarita]|uniref:Uncharacterized protein n=1 Tax=Gigaspora margarita TaxID=4874 RepID=A0A8H4AMP6_GIGMA|nr:hypothetical protein F8M41_017698 [Gigaspora margarita]